MSSIYREYIQPDLEEAERKGRLQGLERGREEARQEAALKTISESRQRLYRMISLKFPTPNKAEQVLMRVAIEGANQETLEAWTLRLLTVDTVEDLFDSAAVL